MVWPRCVIFSENTHTLLKLSYDILTIEQTYYYAAQDTFYIYIVIIVIQNQQTHFNNRKYQQLMS